MSEQIEASALIEAVGLFLAEIEPQLAGRQAFHAKVAQNALAIVARELAQRPAEKERAALAGFLGHDAPLDKLRAELSGRLRSGQLTPETPGLLEALTEAVLAKCAVDNPRYATFKRMTSAA
jgi:alkylhydroperoxidase family enzyme